MRLGQADFVQLYRIFLSSGDDALLLRDRVTRLVDEVLSPQLKDAGEQIRFEIDRWERTAAQRTDDTATNAQFVRRALNSQLTLTLLIDQLGAGTREELEAVLAADREVSALWFVPRTGAQQSPVAEFLNVRRANLTYERTGEPASDEAWEGVFRVLIAALIDAMQRRTGPYMERR